MAGLFDNYSEDDIYNAFKFAETGSFNNPWIRTVAKDTKGGSTAFGPVQVTGSLLDLYQKNRPELWSKHLGIGPTLVQQADAFAKYGNEPGLMGYDSKYDYGGTGYGLTDKEKDAYRALTKDMMSSIWDRVKSKDEPKKEFIKAWRGKTAKEDEDYYNRFNLFLDRLGEK